MKQTETKFQGILKPENSRKPPVSRFEANRATLPDIQIQLPQNLLQNFLDSQGTRIKGVRSVISAIDVDRDANTVTFLEFDDSASAKEQAKVIAGLISAARLEAEMSDSPGAENLIWQLDQAVIGMDGKLLNIELPVNTETLLNVFGCK